MTAPPLRLDQFLPYRLSVTASLVSDVIAHAYQGRFGLKVAEWRLVAVLAEASPLTQQEIGQRTRMDKVTVSRAAMALTERALVARAENPADGRSLLLRLSPEGEQLYHTVAPAALALERDLLASLTPAESELLLTLLGRLEAAALGRCPAQAAGCDAPAAMPS